MPREEWSGGNHPGRLRFQTFRPNHGEPLTDAVIGQGKMSLGGGGYGGGGLPYPDRVLELWGGELSKQSAVATPAAPTVLKDDGSGEHEYAIVAVGPQGNRTAARRRRRPTALATLRWDSVPGADAYVVVRDGKEIAGPLRIEGSQKMWTDETLAVTERTNRRIGDLYGKVSGASRGCQLYSRTEQRPQRLRTEHQRAE